MQIIRLEDSPSLYREKMTMQWSLIAMLVCYLASFLPKVGYFALGVGAGIMLWFFVAAYRFSKLTNSTFFRYCISMLAVALSPALVLILLGLLYDSELQEQEARSLLIGFVAYYIGTLFVLTRLWWLACREFSQRTGLIQPLISAKFYLGALLFLLLACVAIGSGVEWRGFYEGRLYITSSTLLYISLLLALLAGISQIIGYVFFLIGVRNIREVSVRATC